MPTPPLANNTSGVSLGSGNLAVDALSHPQREDRHRDVPVQRYHASSVSRQHVAANDFTTPGVFRPSTTPNLSRSELVLSSIEFEQLWIQALDDLDAAFAKSPTWQEALRTGSINISEIPIAEA
ncbi:MAG: hypothetical protein KDK66_09495, partial [Deltaproteobacteria bacterium]|nr:hypothetical protein [Deltaproteobacteria bacterium]